MANHVFTNPRITAKERNLIKGVLRRVFSRSELRLEVLGSTRIEHYDEQRPRVKKWSWCQSCGQVVPTYTISVDHITPVIAVTETFEDLGTDELINRLWCDKKNLQNLCEMCHDMKTKAENLARKEHKRRNKNG